MNIAGSALLNEWARASKQWTVIAKVNERYGLPPYLLHAVGSRETNLTNETGDDGHGHGIFQLDDRSHTIPPGFMNNVQLQAETAATMLVALFHKYGDWVSGCNAYNSGRPYSASTTGGDYGNDVMQRQIFLFQQLGAPILMDWADQLVNHYHDTDPHSSPTLPAGDLVSWAATHAAHAAETATAARSDVAALRAELPGILAVALQGATIKVEILTGNVPH